MDWFLTFNLTPPSTTLSSPMEVWPQFLLKLEGLGHLRGVNHLIAVGKFKADALAFVIELGDLAHGSKLTKSP